MSEHDNFSLIRETNDDYPFIENDKKITHSRYNQTYKGLKVEFAEIFLHHKNDKIEFLNGKLAEGLSLDVSPQVNEQSALNIALNELGNANNYSWLDSSYESSYKEWKNDSTLTSFPQGELLIAKANNNQDYSSEQYFLAWKFRIVSLEPNLSREVFIDAHSGNVIKDIDLIQHGHGNLSYGYGTNAYLDTRWRGGLYSHYVLRSDDDNSPKIWTKEHRSTGAFGGYSCVWPYLSCTPNAFDGDDSWDDLVVTTPHWLGTKAWNYWKEKFNRSSYNNEGAEVRILNNLPTKASSYDPSDDVLRFGRLNGVNGGPHQATRDILGHEFGHAVLRYTVANGNLGGYGESGALGESFSDIFGYELERYINGGHLNWSLGEDTEVRRRMNNPSQSVIYGPDQNCSDHNQAQPAFYHGARWYYGNCDQQGVHINGGVQNYWYYLLTEGSTNALEGTFNNISVNGIGADKAMNIVFYSVDNLLTSNSNYQDSRNGAIAAASFIYGNCSEEKKETQNAWAAVNIGNPFVPLAIAGPSNIFIDNGTIIGNMPIQWTASGGSGRRVSWSTTGAWSWNTVTVPTTPWMWENVFSASNFHGNFNGTISVNDRCTVKSKSINFYHLSNSAIDVIEISPNPVISTMQVQVNFKSANPTDPITVWIHGLDGQVYFHNQFTENIFSVSSEELQSGNYYITAQQSGIQKSVNFNKH